MTSQHANPQRSWRPDQGEHAEAKARLAERGYNSLNPYLRAALRWLNHDPDAALAALAPYWPEPKRGRPRRQTPGHEADQDAGTPVA